MSILFLGTLGREAAITPQRDDGQYTEAVKLPPAQYILP